MAINPAIRSSRGLYHHRSLPVRPILPKQTIVVPFEVKKTDNLLPSDGSLQLCFPFSKKVEAKLYDPKGKECPLDLNIPNALTAYPKPLKLTVGTWTIHIQNRSKNHTASPTMIDLTIEHRYTRV